MTTKLKKVLMLGFSLAALFCYGSAFASQSDIDPSFHFNIPFGTNSGPGKIAVQADGKILVVGGFTTYNGVPASRLMRLYKDFSLDTSFNIGAGFDTGYSSYVQTVTIQPDGKILVGGTFLKYQGFARSSMVRINIDGSIDASFNMTGITANGIYSIAVQADGKILLGGAGFTTSDGGSRGVIRLNSDGTLDAGFDIGRGINGQVNAIKVQADGKILVGGYSLYTGTAANRMFRLNTDGSRDFSFDIGTGFDRSIRDIAIDSNNKIVVGGYFTSFRGVPTNAIIRLNSDGSRDTTFTIGNGFPGGGDVAVHGISIDKNGKIVAIGYFWDYNGTSANRIIRLNSNGSRDNTFNIGTAFGSYIYNRDVEIGTDDKIIVAGSFSEYQGILSPKGLIAINPDGSRDNTLNNVTKGFDRTVSNLSIQADGKILAGGYFQMYEKTRSPGLVRLNADGSRDPSFNVGSGFNVGQYGYDYRWVSKTLIDGSGKILVIGAFTTYQGVAANKIIRLNTDGSRDTTFNIGTAFNSDYYSNPSNMILQADGKILVWGSFTTYQGVSVGKIIRLNNDGSRDTTLPDIGTGFSGGYINSVGIDPDGKFIIGGTFTSHKGLTGNHMIRLNQDGSRDMTFDSGIGFGWHPGVIAIQPDGKILAGGNIFSYQGVNVKGVVRINTNGSIDTGFVAANIFDRNCGQEVANFFIQSDGKILAWGGGKLIRFNSNGSLDTSFIADESQGCVQGRIFGNGGPSAVALSPSGNMVIAGNFTSYRGVPVEGIISLFGNSSVVNLPNSTNTGAIADAFTTKGYVETDGQFYGIAPISLSETDGTIPTKLNITNNIGSISLPQGTQVVTTSNSANYSGIISVPFGAQFIKSISDMSVLSIFKVGSDLNKLSLLGNTATIAVPVSGNVGDRVYIYYSDNNEGSWYPEKVSTIIDNNGVPYVSFTTNHLAEFAVLGRSGEFTGGFQINNGASTTNTRIITLNLYANPVAQMMRFSNDNITRSDWALYSTSKVWVLGGALGENTVYAQFDVDGDGNSDVYTTQSIIYNDTVAPVISLIGNPTVNVDQNSIYEDAGAIASDDRDGNISQNIIVSGEVDTTVLGNYIITYNVSDAVGNAAIEVTRTVNVLSPNPTISLIGDSVIDVDQDSVYIDAGAVASDNKDGNISQDIIVSGEVDTSTLGSYILTYNVSDSDNNAAESITRTVNVKEAGILNSDNIASKYGCETDAYWCDFSSRNIVIIEPNTFVNHSNLQSINLQNNQIRKIERDTFNGLSNLSDLNLGTNQIILIETGAFNQLPNLTALYLYSNQITTLPDGIFDGLTNLQSLNISNNQLPWIVGGIFDGLTNLSELYLSQNPLSVVEDASFGGLERISYVDISNSCSNHMLTISRYSCNNGYSYDEQSCLSEGYCSNEYSSDKQSCESSSFCTDGSSQDQTTCETNGYCSDGNYSDQVSCESSSSCTDGSSQDQTTCETNGQTWNTNTWNSYGYTWNTNTWNPYYTWGDSIMVETSTDTNYCSVIESDIDTFINNELSKGYSNGDGGLLQLGSDYYIGQLDLNFSKSNMIPINIVMRSTNTNGYGDAYYQNPVEIQYTGGTALTTSGIEFTGILSNPELFAPTKIPGVTGAITLMRFGSLMHKIDFDTPIIIRMPALGRAIGSSIKIYSSDDQDIYQSGGVEWLFENTGTVIDINGTPYVQFTTNHASRYVLASSAKVAIKIPDQSDGNDGNTTGSNNTGSDNNTPSNNRGGSSHGDSSSSSDSIRSNKIIENPVKPVETLFHNAADRQGNISNSKYSKEMNSAYLRAYKLGITDAPSIQNANMEGTLIRSHMAKMVTEYAINVLKKEIDTGAKCEFKDMKSQSEEMQYYTKTACQLGLMGLKTDGNTNHFFNPELTITRAQFGTVLSRLLYSENNNRNKGDTGDWYSKHLVALKKAGIMSKINKPANKEVRGWVMLMMMRAAK